MRTVLAVLFMSLATQAFGDDIEKCDSANPFTEGDYSGCSNQKICKDVHTLCHLDPAIILAKYSRESWIRKCNILASNVADRGLKCLTWQAKQDKLKDRAEIASKDSSKNLMQIVSSNTGVENDIIATLQVIKGDFNKLSKSERLELQLVLKARGMYQAELDGAWGKYSRIAFAMYLGPKLQLSSAKNTEELFNEIKKGFLIDELWEREDFEKDLQEIWQTDARNKQELCRICSSGINSGSRSSSSSRSTSDDVSIEPLYGQWMYINNELKRCSKVGNSLECD